MSKLVDDYMNLYAYQRSRSFIVLGPKSLRVNIIIVSFPIKNIRLIEAIFHVEPSWDGRMKVSTNGLCHLTKMAAVPIYAKKSKFSSLEPKGR